MEKVSPVGKSPKPLLLCPLPFEFRLLRRSLEAEGLEFLEVLRSPLQVLETSRFFLAKSGLGKSQAALQAQFLIDRLRANSLICLGSAGALVPELQVGDLVVATEVIEWGFGSGSSNQKIGQTKRFQCDLKDFTQQKALFGGVQKIGLRGLAGPILCCEEFVNTDDRARELHDLTQAVAVSWEGAGIARVAEFHQIPFLEVRVISDSPLVANAQFGNPEMKKPFEKGFQVLAQALLDEPSA